MTTPTLSPAQARLLTAMRERDVIVFRMKGFESYCFRSDTHARCTATADALLKNGLIEEYRSDWKSASYRAVKKGNADEH